MIFGGAITCSGADVWGVKQNEANQIIGWRLTVKIARIVSWIAATVGLCRGILGRQRRPEAIGTPIPDFPWGVRRAKARRKHRTTVGCRQNRRARNRVRNRLARQSRQINQARARR